MLAVAVAQELARVVRHGLRAAPIWPGLKVQARTHALEPKGKPASIEIPIKFTLGEKAVFHKRLWPAIDFASGRVQFDTIGTNVPCPNAVIFGLIKVGNVGLLVSSRIDAFVWREPLALDVPTMTYGTAITLFGTYTGLVPEGMRAGEEFEFKVTLSGHEPKLQEDVAATPDTEDFHAPPAP